MKARHAIWLWLIGTTLLLLSSIHVFESQVTVLRLVGLGLEWFGLAVLAIKVMRYPGAKDFLNS